jgi:hypothetical protein
VATTVNFSARKSRRPYTRRALLRTFARATALAGFLLAIAAAPPPLTVSNISANFVQAEFATHYTVTAQSPGAALTYQWRLIPPTADPGCNHFSTTGNTAVWHHGDQDGCNHNVQVAQGHPGTVIVTVSNGGFSCTSTYFGTITGEGPVPQCTALNPITPSAGVTPTAAAAAHQPTGIPAWQIGVAVLVFLAVAGTVGYFLIAARRDPCDELRDRCNRLQAEAKAAAERAGAAKAAAAAARKACDEAKKAREQAEQRLRAASGEGGSWIEGSEHPGERLSSHDLGLQAQYEASVRAQVQSGEISEAQGQELLSHWDDPAQWNRLRREEKDRADSDVAAAKAAESSACAEADRRSAEADSAAAAAAAAQKAADEACAAADECEKQQREKAATATPPPVTPPPPPPPPPGTTVSPPAVVQQPPPPKTQEKPQCEEGDTRTEVRCQTEVDMYRLGEISLTIGNSFQFGQEDVDKAMAGLTDAMWVIDIGSLAVSAVDNAPLAAGTWIAGKAGFPSFDTITSLPQDAALDGLRKLIERMRNLRYIGTYTLSCNRYHLKARCEVKYECHGGHWVVTDRNMIIEQVGPPQTVTAPPEEVVDPREGNRAIQKMANFFRGGNRGQQQKLDDCAKKCQA